MTEHDDDKVAAAYRSLARAEPPAALDAAILAASKRAVAPARRSRDWGVPVSIAALLMLSAGLTLHMQQEQPGVELREPGPRDAAPAAPAPPPALPDAYSASGSAPVEEQPKEAEAVPARKQKADMPSLQKLSKPSPQPAVPAKSIQSSPLAAAPVPFPQADMSRKDLNVAEPRQEAPAAASVAPSPSVSATTSAVRTELPPGAPPAPRAFTKESAVAEPQASARVAAPAPAQARAAAAGAAAPSEKVAPAMAPRAKREASAGVAADSVSREAPPMDERERELERIAKLRAEGRDAEADKAIEEFRRRYPDYRIAPAMWERVKPRP
jgi:hypothetical protein